MTRFDPYRRFPPDSTDAMVKTMAKISRAMARPDRIDWYAVLVFWLVCIDLGAVAALVVARWS